MAPPYTEVVVAVLSRQARKKRSRDSSGSGTRPWSSCSRALRFSKSSVLRPVNWSLYFRRCWKNAVRIFGAKFGNLLLYEEGAFRVAAMHDAPSVLEELRRRER